MAGVFFSASRFARASLSLSRDAGTSFKFAVLWMRPGTPGLTPVSMGPESRVSSLESQLSTLQLTDSPALAVADELTTVALT